MPGRVLIHRTRCEPAEAVCGHGFGKSSRPSGINAGWFAGAHILCADKTGNWLCDERAQAHSISTRRAMLTSPEQVTARGSAENVKRQERAAARLISSDAARLTLYHCRALAH